MSDKDRCVWVNGAEFGGEVIHKSGEKFTQGKIPVLDMSVVVATGYCSNAPYWLKNDYPKAQYPNKWKGKCRVGFEKRRLAGASAFIRKGQNSAHRISFKF
ncbi:hypothetical protein H5410_047361 [Solanum commersonii]|uniref:Uncharacterized protein n=1 Tax=Solanum commersonii TaxID=4109 RepID=A0A9J5XH28_SOLCO|nr:hypothetical protein H5410_047361 [Solanum commersonii]